MPAIDTWSREKALTGEVIPIVERSVPGIEVLAVELLSPGRFCVYVDHAEGVDFALCERVTRVLDDFRTKYAVDVSSPGPDRPLRKPAHFRSVEGRQVLVRLEAERTKRRGEVVTADDSTVTLRINDAEIEIPYDAIVRANLIDEGWKGS